MSTHEETIDRFDQAWRNGNVPKIAEFVAGLDPENHADLLAELVCIDMEYRWRTSRGEDALETVVNADEETSLVSLPMRPLTEYYLNRWEELKSENHLTLILSEEFRVRQQWGDSPSVQDYLQRFPDCPRLMSSLQVATEELQVERPESSLEQLEKTLEEFPEKQTLGRYELIRVIGSGGMGDVYLAHDPMLERKVALKTPRFQKDDELAKQRFLNEARTAATIHHPHICPIFDAGEIDGQLFLTMAFVVGETLKERGPKASLDQNLLWLAQIASAMQSAHDLGIVHRDLKPTNIMINENHDPVVMDFGLAIRAKLPGEERLTQTGETLGSPAYMSPEQVEGRISEINERSDIYSLGVILYETITGAPPFTGSIGSLMAAIVRDQPQLPSKTVSHVDVELEQLCLQMLAKQPNDRPQSMGDVAERLSQIRQRLVTGDEAQPPHQRPWRWFAAALVPLAVIAAFVIFNIRTPHGNVQIQVAEEIADTVKVRVLQNGKLINVADAERGWSISLAEGDYEVEPGKSASEFDIAPKHLTVREGKPTLVTVTATATQPETNTTSPLAIGENDVVGTYRVEWREADTAFHGTVEYTLLSDHTVMKGERECGTWRIVDDRVRITFFDSDRGRVFLKVDQNGDLEGTHTWANGSVSIWSGQRLADSDTKTPSHEDVDSDWQPLFNGKDLTGWQPWLTYGANHDIHKRASEGWEVRHGFLVCTTQEHGFLQHEETFDNFELKLEFKLAENRNSGVHVRARLNGNIVNKGMEAQIIDDDYRSPQDPGFKVSSTTRTGAIYAVTGPKSSALRPMGEWNEMRIRCDGDLVEVFVNGTQTASVDTSKKPALKGQPKTGKILISNWMGEAKGVAFKNIRLRKIELPDAAASPISSQPLPPHENLALYFDGVDDHVVTPIKYDGSHPITIEAWVAAAHPWESGRIFDNVAGYGRGIDIQRAEGDKSPKWFTDVMKTGPSSPLVQHYQSPKVNPRTHLAYVWDGKESRFYINGDASGQSLRRPLGEIPSSVEKFLIGTGIWKNRIASEDFFRFHGYIDEIRFSKVARYSSSFKPVDRHEPDSDTIALYHCDDDTAGLILRDSSGNKNDAEITGATRKPSYEMHSPGPYYRNVDAYERSIIKDLPERTGPALRFVTNDAVANVPPVFIDFTEPFTVEFWGTPESEWTLHDLWARVGVAFGQAHVVLSASEDRWLFNFWDHDSIQCEVKRKHTPRMNHRTHVAAQWSGKHLELFINGQPVPGSESGIGGFPNLKERLLKMLTSANERKLTIGSWGKNGQFGGEIDSFRLSIGNRYQQADSPEDVPISFEPQELKADEQTVILYDFHEGEGAVLHDLSGNGYHGEISPEAIWVPAPPEVEPLPGLILEPQPEEEVLRSQLITRWPRAEPCHHTFSPDGKLYALGSMDGYVRIFDGGPEGKLKSVVHIREKRERRPFGMHWAADSTMFFTATNDWVQIWSMEGQLLHEWQHKLTDLEWHPSENILGGADRSRAYLWTPSGEELLSVRTWGDDRGSRFVWSQEGDQFLTVNGKVVLLWTRNGNVVKQIPIDFTVQDCEWSPDGELIVFMTDDKQYVIMSAVGEIKARGSITKYWGDLDLCWAPDSQTFAIADSEFVSIWDRNGNAITRYKSTQFKSTWNCFCFSPDGQQHLVLKIDKGLAIHDAATGKLLRYLQEEVPRLTALDWNRNRELLTTSLMCGASPLAVVNQQGVSQIDSPKVRMYPYDIAWNQTTDDIVVAGNWDLRRFEIEGEKRLKIENSQQLIRGDHLYQKIAVHPLGDLHASVGSDNQVRIVNSKGEVVTTLPMGRSVHEIRFSPDGKWLAVNTAGEAVAIFDSTTWEQQQYIKAGSMFGIAWSSDSTRIVTMIAYGPVKILDLDGKVQQEFEPDWRIGRNHSFTAIAISPDDQWVVTSRDIDMQAFNLETKERRQFPFHVDLIVDAVWISPTEFVIASRDGTLSCYDVVTGERQWITLFVQKNESELKSATLSSRGDLVHVDEGIESSLFHLRERTHGQFEITPFTSP